MIQVLFGIGVWIASVTLLAAAIQAIPSLAALIAVITDNADAIAQAVTSFVQLVARYIDPWIGLMNNIFPQPVKTALVALIVWKMVKPLGLKIMELTLGVSRKVLEKLM